MQTIYAKLRYISVDIFNISYFLEILKHSILNVVDLLN